MLANFEAPGALILYTGLIDSIDICYKDCWLATTAPLVVAESLVNTLSLLERCILLTYTTSVVLTLVQMGSVLAH